MTDCARFETELATLAAGEVAEEERAALLERLRAHAARCAECRGSGDLLLLLAEPPGSRDLVDAPGEAYWKGFQDRLDARIRAGAGAPVRGNRGRALLAIAAMLLVALAAAWIVMRDRQPADEPAIATTEPLSPRSTPDHDEAPLLPPSEAFVEPADEEELALVFEGWADPEAGGWGAGWDDGGLFPEVETLDDGARRELLRWLEEQSS